MYKTPFYIMFYSNTEKWNKQNKNVKVVNLPVGRRNRSMSIPCTPMQDNVILIMLFSPLEGDLRKVSKISTS